MWLELNFASFAGKPTNADEMIGSLKINISDVARNDRLRDTFALQETQKGDIQLTLDWHPIEVGDMSSLEQTGDQKEVERFKKQQDEDKKRYCHSNTQKQAKPNIQILSVFLQKENAHIPSVWQQDYPIQLYMRVLCKGKCMKPLTLRLLTYRGKGIDPVYEDESGPFFQGRGGR